jgi:tRNA-specific 2-thiouridylase
LGIDHHVVDFCDEFDRFVISRFVDEYNRGRTPNPCILCNRHLKFEMLLDYAQQLGCDFIATGHYARIDLWDGRFRLLKGVDASKDQSYVLAMLTQQQLAHVLFPLGGLTKDRVRAIAAESGLPTASKRESQDICFIPDGDYVSFLERENGCALTPGSVVDLEGNVLGQHRGMAAYTIGQRKGLGVASSQPLYVCRKDAQRNEVVLGPHDALAVRTVRVTDWNWVCPPSGSGEPVEGMAKLRYRQAEHPCNALQEAEGIVRLEFCEPEYGVAAGQTAVLYRGDEVLGSGTIEQALA